MKKKDSIVQDDSEAAYLKREADKKAAADAEMNRKKKLVAEKEELIKKKKLAETSAKNQKEEKASGGYPYEYTKPGYDKSAGVFRPAAPIGDAPSKTNYKPSPYEPYKGKKPLKVKPQMIPDKPHPIYGSTWDNPPTPEREALKQRILEHINNNYDAQERKNHDRITGLIARRFFDRCDDVSSLVLNPNGLPLTDIDIKFDFVFIEVTSGNGSGKVDQLRDYSSRLANPEQLPIIAFNNSSFSNEIRTELINLIDSNEHNPGIFIIEKGLYFELESILLKILGG